MRVAARAVAAALCLATAHAAAAAAAKDAPAAADKDAAAAAEPVCDLEAYPSDGLPAVEALLQKHLKPKHAAQIAALLKKPCETFEQGVVLNLVQMRNTNRELAAFTIAALKELDAPAVAGVWARLPRRARVWTLKAFVAGLPCTVKRRATACAEAETNAVMEKFAVAREAYADAALERRGMAPFPAAEEEESSDEGGIAEYAARLGVEGAAAEWLVEEFKPSAADKMANPNVTLVDPAWWKPVQASCRQQANLRAPGSSTKDETNLTDLDVAVSRNLWKWHYKTCHKNAALYAYEHKDDEAAAAAAGVDAKSEL